MVVAAGLWNQVDLVVEELLQNETHFDLVLRAAVVFERKNQWQVSFVLARVLSNGLNNRSEGHRCRHREAVLDNWTVAAVVDVQLDAPDPVVEVFDIPKCLRVARELVADEIGVVGTVNVVLRER